MIITIRTSLHACQLYTAYHNYRGCQKIEKFFFLLIKTLCLKYTLRIDSLQTGMTPPPCLNTGIFKQGRNLVN